MLPLGRIGSVDAASPWGLRKHVGPLVCPRCLLTFFMEAQGHEVMVVWRREHSTPGPPAPHPSPASLSKSPVLLCASRPVASLRPVSPPQIQAVVADSQRLRDAWGGSSWSACVLTQVVATHPSCPCGGLPLSTGLESLDLQDQNNLAASSFSSFLPSFIRFSFLLHAAQRMQKAAKIKKKAVCRAEGLAWVSGPRPVQFGRVRSCLQEYTSCGKQLFPRPWVDK